MAKQIKLHRRNPGVPRRREQWRDALHHRRDDLTGAVAGSVAQALGPLGALLTALQPQLGPESVFRTRRKLLRAHWDAAYAELQAEYPRHQVLVHAFGTLTELLRAEARDISPEQWQQAAKELALATLRNAPALISAARQARLLH